MSSQAQANRPEQTIKSVGSSMHYIAFFIFLTMAALAVLSYRHRDRSYPVNDRLRIIEGAMAAGRDLEMEYFTNSSKRLGWRIVTPLNISFHSQRPYLRAYCHLRREERTFRVSRIKSIRDIPQSRRHSAT